jgi:4-amino-4-deoxy-L-arabinose transferase-like glycosyltransferase
VKQNAHVRLELIILAAVLLVAGLARFVHLHAWPLTDSEAEHALTAAVNTQNGSDFWMIDFDMGTQSPLYNLMTRPFFQIFGASDLTARLAPALAGFLLLVVFLILYREDRAGLRLIWLFLLSFSPILLTSSRTANGAIFAAASLFPIFIILTWKDIRSASSPYLMMALVTGIALSSGSAVFKAATTIAFAFLIAFMIQRDRFHEILQKVSWTELRKVFWLIPVVALLVLSGFGSSLEGIRGFARALEEWLLGWVRPSGFSFLELSVFLFTSDPLIVFFGIFGSVRLWQKRDYPGWLVSLWAISAWVLLLFYPGRAPFDLIWVILPLSYLAAHGVLELFEAVGDLRSNLELIGLLGLLITFIASGALSLVAYGSGNVLTVNPNNPNLVLFLFLALAVMGLSVLVFFGVGWSWSVVIHATGILALILSIAQGISTFWRLNFSRDGHRVGDLWWQTVPAEGLPLLVQSLEHTAMAHSGQRDMLPIDLQDEASASMAWALRDFELVKGDTAFGVEAPPVILAQEDAASAFLPADYIGQSLGIREIRAWDTALPPELLKWWIGREVPVTIEPWILWVRADIASFGELGFDNEELD